MGEIGMAFEDVRKRLKRMERTQRQGKVKNDELKNNLEQSLVRQAFLREDIGAAKELQREFGLKGIPDDVTLKAKGYGRAVKIGNKWYPVDEVRR